MIHEIWTGWQVMRDAYRVRGFERQTQDCSFLDTYGGVDHQRLRNGDDCGRNCELFVEHHREEFVEGCDGFVEGMIAGSWVYVQRSRGAFPCIEL